MRNLSLIFSFILFAQLEMTIAQWQPNLRLTNDPAHSYTGSQWGIAANGNYVHVVWYDNRDGNNEIYYKRSVDGGLSWGADTRLTNHPQNSWYPSIAAFGSSVYIVWMDNRETHLKEDVIFMRSTNNGSSWEPEVRLTFNDRVEMFPNAAVWGNVLHVVWEEVLSTNSEIFYTRSTNAGINWGAETRLTFDSLHSENPAISVSGSNVHIVWFDDRNGNNEIYYKRSADGGIIWSPDTRLTFNPDNSLCPSITTFGSIVHTAWHDQRDGNREIYYKQSSNSGLNWGNDIRLTSNASESWYTSISATSPMVHIVWYDSRDGNDEIYYKQSTDGGNSWGIDTRLTDNISQSWYPFISLSGTVVHVSWTDFRDGNPEIYYSQNPTGNIIGIKNISTEIPNEFSLSQNYPNPFNPTTKIKFEIPNSKYETNSKTEIRIYDLKGSEIAVLVNEQLNPGTYEVDWNASNYSSGVYYYRLITSDYTSTRKMVLIK